MPDEAAAAFSLSSSAFDGELLRVGAIEVVEALDEPYRARVVLPTSQWRDEPDLSAFLGADAVLEIVRGDAWTPRRVSGVIERVTQLDPTEDGVAVELVPALAYLAKGRNTRIFQEMTVPDILEAVLRERLEEYGRRVALQLEGDYEAREYCVQYQESDFDFVSRLMEEEGIHYGFDHLGEVELLCLRDANDAFETLAPDELVPYGLHDFVLRDVEPVLRFDRVHRATPTSVALRDWDWTAGSAETMVLAAEARAEGLDGGDREQYEHGEGRTLSISSFDEGVRRYQHHDADAQARRRGEGFLAGALHGVGMGRVTAFVPGAVFELSGHPALGADGRYLITRVRHVSEPAPRIGGGDDRYHNTFECIPADTAYRPRRRASKPRILGTQTAVVTGPSGEEVHVDGHGRIRVQMHWDREGGLDEHSACWIRVRQPWAGATWGSWWVPRIGMEVVVQFSDGDPDRPLVTGAVYNGANALPYPQPDEKTKSTIRSNSSLGGGGFNELRFEDAAGSEEIFVHAQKDYNEVVENDHTTQVGNNQTNTVDVDQTQTIHQNQVEQVDGNQEMTVDGNRTVQVTANFDETVDGTETRHTTGDVTETFDANETRDIGASVTESIAGDETRDVAASQAETVGAAHTLTISGDRAVTIGATLDVSAAAGITTITPAAFDITATGGQTINATGGITVVAPGGINITAPGGVHRIDNSWIAFRGENLVVGLNQTEITGVKGSICAIIASCFNGVKAEDTILEMNGCGTDMIADGTVVGFKTVKLENDGCAWHNGFKIKA
jgi:type VI secretion system secreted protein VgrG